MLGIKYLLKITELFLKLVSKFSNNNFIVNYNDIKKIIIRFS